ncbi:hypothetical protein PLESTB_000483400 [Pleodorina starrii]|uniref:Squalene synthase n=1 Tax=Pleodorina starrii TaxID=330485 RepID=A0A9W6BG98_9CHLO|nr:hypothetical protein PLESTM_000354600 [Pleodorina starrii]GLC51260.1 hypothetical protein PLESTB_000483400 [Pleodorina starrii]GLC63620.1 hypothetical protein PLESTF_000056300 [Pleodorina starrii]
MGKLGDILSHPDEFLPMVRMMYAARKASMLPKDPGLAFCYGMLNDVSRSFAIVIQQLPNPLRDAICVFYLVLRGLDTVEDDMALDISFKVPQLKAFHERIYQRGFTMACGTKHYKRLMAQFDIVVNVFLSLEPAHQKVIADITRRMGYGMAEFIEKEVVTVKDYDQYCHYVAGLVGIGLSHLFAACGLESPSIAVEEDLANHMGLFLQKTNIIRDYLEDIMEEPAPRMFWPKEVWGRYGSSLDDFKSPANRKQAVQCLNHLVTDALRHLPYCLQYMKQLKHVLVFRFCAIPQIMAAGTLALCYNNGKIFEGVVKLRRGETAKVFESCNDLGDVYRWFIRFLEVMRTKVESQVAVDDPSLAATRQEVSASLERCFHALAEWRLTQAVPGGSALAVVRDVTALALTGSYFYYVWRLGGPGPEALPELLRPYAWVLDQQEQVQRAVAAVLLLVVFAAVVSERKKA